MRIIELQSENLKRLKAVAIRPDRSVIQITGRNGSGKTSVLDSIVYALGGKSFHPTHPIRQGEQSATVRLNLGDLRITRRFTPSGTTVLVESPDGARYPSPQAMLDAIIGELSFDPLAFSRLPEKAKLERLRGVVTVDADLDAIDAEVKRKYDARTDKNRLVKSLTERAALLEQAVAPAMDTELENVDALIDQLTAVQEHNADVERRQHTRAARLQKAESYVLEMASIKEQMTRLSERLVQIEEEHTALVASLHTGETIPEPKDPAVLRVAINEARARNAEREAQERARSAHQAALSELTAASLESENLTADIDELTAKKQSAIANATMPVPGLSFGDGEITYNGLPLAQASSAEQLRVAVAIGMALNPKLRVLCIKDGSLLDETSLALLEQMATEHDFQVWIERVDSSGTVGIAMEDGSIAAIDGEPVAVTENTGEALEPEPVEV